MRTFTVSDTRRGVILPLVVFSMIALFGFLALAIDIGMIAAAKTQAQNAADAAAMAGARTLDGYRPLGTASDAPITTADNHYADAGPNAATAAKANSILGIPITDSQINITIGKYVFDSTKSKFFMVGNGSQPLERASVTDVVNVEKTYSWSLSHAVVNFSGGTYFGKFLGAQLFNVTARAAAVHRPRDVIICMDYSGSMANDSALALGYMNRSSETITPGGTVESRFSNNPDEDVPKFAAYSDPTAKLVQTGTGLNLDGDNLTPANATSPEATNKFREPLLDSFYAAPQTSAGVTPAKAFTNKGPGDAYGYVSGDRYLMVATGPSGAKVPNSGTTFAKTLAEALGAATRNAAWETNGYAMAGLNYAPKTGAAGAFQGYIEGPAYFGKTFFIWPPDPRPQYDWRQKFFLQKNAAGAWVPLNDNALLYTAGGAWRSPRYLANPANPANFPNATTGANSFYSVTAPPNGQDYYRPNYEAILKWIFETGPNPFPAQFRAGRCVYYDAVPYPPPAGLNARWWTQTYNAVGGSAFNERFWKEFIDHVLGLKQTGNTPAYQMLNQNDLPSVNTLTGYGRDFPWGATTITPASLLQTADPNLKMYINYADNPRRPRTHFWFGPLMMVDFIYNECLDRVYISGANREQPLFAAKIGMQGALRYIEKNHPNDMVGLIFFNGADSRFRRVRVGLGKDYKKMTDSLWYPPKTLLGTYNPSAPPDSANGPLRWKQSDFTEVPNAAGGTNYPLPLMLAFNQWSENPSLRTFNPGQPKGDAGGNGRRGAQKLLVFMTDGQPNSGVPDSFSSSPPTATGANYSYYNVRYSSAGGSDAVNPTGYSYNAPPLRDIIYRISRQICADMTASSPGFSSARKPVSIHCLGFGQLFETDTAERRNSYQTFQQMEYIGKTQGPGTDYPNLPPNTIPSWKEITGTDAEINQKLVKALSNVMRSGFQLSLIL